MNLAGMTGKMDEVSFATGSVMWRLNVLIIVDVVAYGLLLEEISASASH